MIETLIGSLIGGAFRLAPEFLKIWDRKNERTHELSMQDKGLEFERVRGANRQQEVQESSYQEGIRALMESVRGQSQLVGNKVVDALNQLVRPVTTYWMLLLYSAVKVASFVILLNADVGVAEAIKACWTEADQGLFAGILNFWFLGRVLDKRPV